MDWNWPEGVTVSIIGLLGILLGTIAGGAVSLVTTQLTRRDQAIQRTEDRKERAEESKRAEERWQAEYFMSLRVEALRDSLQRLIKIRTLLFIREPDYLSPELNAIEINKLLRELRPESSDYVLATTLIIHQLSASKARALNSVPGAIADFHEKMVAFALGKFPTTYQNSAATTCMRYMRR